MENSIKTPIGRKVLVTGATGFIGRRLCERLLAEGYEVRGTVRRTSSTSLIPDVEGIDVGDFVQKVDWSLALLNVDSVVHLAARVHVMHELVKDPLAEFRKINVVPTIDLARQAAKAGVRRFIFISSIKVNGESTPIDRPFTADDIPAPVDPYGISKYEAELELAKVAEETGMELVILRPVIVYGVGVSANFKEMMGWLNKGLPLPFGLVKNRRSLVAIDNLVDFIFTCLVHPKAANQKFLVSDGMDLSTPELLKLTASAMNKRILLIPVPVALLKGFGLLIGMDLAIKRLCESLCVDIRKNRDLLEWAPPISVEHSLEETALHFLSGYNR